MPIEIADDKLVDATACIQRDIAAGSTNSALDHLGEAASIASRVAKTRSQGEFHRRRYRSATHHPRKRS
jgi:hypothetical protein